MKKKVTAVLTALLMLAAAAAPAFAAPTISALQRNVMLTQSFFEEKRTVPTWLFEDLKKEGNSMFTLSTKAYSVTFRSSGVLSPDPKVERYDFTLNRRLTKLKDFNNAVGEYAPKAVFETVHEGDFPAATTFTIHDGCFAPYSEVNVYKYLGNGKFEPADLGITVGTDCDYSFTVSSGGTYMVTNRDLSNPINDVLAADYPELTDVYELMSFMTEDSRYDFSGFITRRDPNDY